MMYNRKEVGKMYVRWFGGPTFKLLNWILRSPGFQREMESLGYANLPYMDKREWRKISKN